MNRDFFSSISAEACPLIVRYSSIGAPLPPCFAQTSFAHSELSTKRKKGGSTTALFDIALFHVETLLEAIHASACINQLLLAGVERMALAANFDTDLRLRGTGLDDVAAGAGDGAIHIIRMDAFLHCNFTSFWIMTYGSHTQYMRSSQSPNVGYQHTPSCANGAAI